MSQDLAKVNVNPTNVMSQVVRLEIVSGLDGVLQQLDTISTEASIWQQPKQANHSCAEPCQTCRARRHNLFFDPCQAMSPQT